MIFSPRRFVCHMKTDNDTDRDLILKSSLYTIKHYNLQTGANITYKYAVPQNDLPTVCYMFAHYICMLKRIVSHAENTVSKIMLRTS